MSVAVCLRSNILLMRAQTFTQQGVEDLFTPYGPIEKCTLLFHPGTNQCRGIGFIKYYEHRSATDAIRGLHGHILPGTNRPLQVKFAKASVLKSSGDPSASSMPSGYGPMTGHFGVGTVSQTPAGPAMPTDLGAPPSSNVSARTVSNAPYARSSNIPLLPTSAAAMRPPTMPNASASGYGMMPPSTSTSSSNAECNVYVAGFPGSLLNVVFCFLLVSVEFFFAFHV